MLNKINRYKTIVVLSIFMMPTLSFAWGSLGHAITVSIAERLLTDKTKDFIKSVYPNAPLGSISNYPDSLKAKYKEIWPASPDWHFVDIPVCRSFTPLTIEQFCVDSSDVSGQNSCGMKQYWYFLQNVTKMSGQEQEMALAYLLHLLGDYHQPLHVSNNADRGGNNQLIVMPGRDKAIKLHLAWDVMLVDGAVKAVKGRSVNQFVDEIYKNYQSKFTEYRKGSLGEWLLESFELSNSFVYGKLPGFTCSTPGSISNLTLHLSEEYVQQAQVLITELLVKSGVRMAMLLNQAIDGTVPDHVFPKPTSMKKIFLKKIRYIN